MISTIGGLLSTYNGKGVEKPVQITLVNDIPTVDYDPVKVDRCKGDWVNWTCPEADRFEVEFTVKSPFSGKKYGGPKTAKSDKCKADADVGGHKYLIRVWKGGKLYEVDPIADVEDGGDE